MAVEPHHLGFAGDSTDRGAEVDPRPEEIGYFVDCVDEGKRAKAGEVRRHGVRELKGESRERRHRPADVAEKPDLGSMGPRMAKLGVGRHAPDR